MRKWIAIVLLIACWLDCSRPAGSRAAGARSPIPQRRAKLATAFADIDRILGDYATSVHAPGAAWGIVIDGELAHQGVMGVRDVAAKAPVDADTVFRIASMTKSFTAMSILKLRDAGKLSLDDPAEHIRPGVEEPPLPDDGLAADHHPPPAHALGRLSGRQPVGRSAALRERGGAVAHAARAAFRSRTRRASPTSTRTTASRFSAVSCRACRASPTTSTSPRTS